MRSADQRVHNGRSRCNEEDEIYGDGSGEEGVWEGGRMKDRGTRRLISIYW